MSFSNTFLDKCKETLTWLGLLTCVGHLANSLQSKGNAERVCEVDVSPNCPKTLGHQASGLNNEDLYSGDYQICHGSHHAVCKNEIVLQLFFRVLLEKPSWPLTGKQQGDQKRLQAEPSLLTETGGQRKRVWLQAGGEPNGKSEDSYCWLDLEYWGRDWIRTKAEFVFIFDPLGQLTWQFHNLFFCTFLCLLLPHGVISVCFLASFFEAAWLLPSQF